MTIKEENKKEGVHGEDVQERVQKKKMMMENIRNQRC